MKKLRILQVSFDCDLRLHQLPAFRGAIASKVGWEHHWFHNHDNENGGYFNRYPLIQYKLNPYKGQMRPMLLCLEHGIEEAQHLFGQSDWTLNIQGSLRDLKIAHLNVNRYTLHTWEHFFIYRLYKWQAMNPENYKKYQLLRGIAARTYFLEQLLKNQILSFAKGVAWDLSEDFSVKILSLPIAKWVDYKNGQKTLVFTLDFETAISLPNFIGLGKGASRGLGVLKQLIKE